MDCARVIGCAPASRRQNLALAHSRGFRHLCGAAGVGTTDKYDLFFINFESLITRHRSHLDPTSTSRMYSIVYTWHDGSRNEGAEDKNLVIFCQDMPNERRRAFAYQTSIRFNRCNGATFHKIFASDTVARSPRWHPTPREQVLMTTLELVGFTPSCSDYWRKDFNLSEPP